MRRHPPPAPPSPPSPPPPPLPPPSPSPGLPPPPPSPAPGLPPPSPGAVVYKVTTEFLLSGSVSDYDAEEQAAIKKVLATEADVSTAAVRLTLTAGSVLIAAEIFFATQSGANFAASTLSTGVVATATSLETAINEQFAADGLGSWVSVQQLLSAPQAIIEGATSEESSSGAGVIVVIVGAGGGVGAVVLLVCLCAMRRRGKSSGAAIAPAPRPKAVSASTPVMSMASGSNAVLSLSHQASKSAGLRMTKAQELLKSWEVDACDLFLFDQLGEGGQAVVLRGMWCGIEVAVKQPKKAKELSQKNLLSSNSSSREMDSFSQALRREVRALSRVRHPNVVRLYGACFEPAPMVLMAYAPSGTLQDAVDASKFQGISEIIRVLAGIARGMEAVHAHKIIHLDLKPENVLIGPLDVPWITDFGLSTSANMTSMSQSSAGGRGMPPPATLFA